MTAVSLSAASRTEATPNMRAAKRCDIQQFVGDDEVLLNLARIDALGLRAPARFFVFGYLPAGEV